MKLKQLIIIALVSGFTALGTVGLYNHFVKEEVQAPSERVSPVSLTRYLPPPAPARESQPVDFTRAASRVNPTVVHIKTLSRKSADPGMNEEIFRWFYGDRYRNQPQERESRSSGSGVIISGDGYIVTNNHVVEGATELEVTTFNNETYKAEIVGTDKDTDLALIKVKGGGLESIRFANSDSVLVGEWVLAVGNPFNLSSTVTAGIVSAKGRNIDILRNFNGTGNTAVESFIQTDAAVNPGNSGGALVNINGELIGINTAIATPTGTFAGYSFAVPSNLVQKVIEDLREFGTVQRGFLGVNIQSVDEQWQERLDLDLTEGVVLVEVLEGSAAQEAGLQKNDVIVSINGRAVKSSSELQELVARYRPGDMLEVEYVRNDRKAMADVQLKNRYNEVSLIDDDSYLEDLLGAELEAAVIPNDQRMRMGIRGESGLRVKTLREGRLKQYTGIKEGFVITHFNDQRIESLDEAVRLLKNSNGTISVEGILPNKQYAYLYAFKM